MSSHRPPAGDWHGHGYRPIPSNPRNDRDDRAYDDRHSTSRNRYRHSPSPRRRSPPYDYPRSPPRGPAADRGFSERDTRRDRDLDYERGDRGRNRSYSPHNRNGRGRYRDRDRENYRSPSYDRSRSRSRSPYYGGPPSKEVILEGLPLEIGEEDVGHPAHFSYMDISAISAELKQYFKIDALENVRVIRDRQSGQSRGFGFLRFASLSESRDFVERNFPTIHLYGSGNSGDGAGTKVRISYTRERDDRPKPIENQWECPNCSKMNFPRRQECFRCQTPKPDFTTIPAAEQLPFVNTGDSDVTPDATPSQYLIVRNLEAGVTEQLLAKGVEKLYRPSGGSSPQSSSNTKKAGAKVSSTTSDTNLGAKEGSLRRVLLVRDRQTNESWRYGFAEFSSVEDAQAAMTKFNSVEKFTISSKPVLVNYIHAGVFVPVFNYDPSVQSVTFSALNNPAMRLSYWDEGAYVSELVVNEETIETTKEQKLDDPAATAAEREGLAKDVEKSKKRKAETSTTGANKKAVPGHLEFWRNRHAELHGIKPKASSEDNTEEDTPKEKSKSIDSSPSVPPSQSYADLERNCCYLCSRQFKSSAEVNKHERLSQLHQDNLKNEELKAKAIAKLNKAASKSTGTQEYRDRAKERRQIYNQPNAPVRKTAEQRAEKAQKKAEQEETPAPSKGASLLGKMGWSAGQGLGAQGTGMVAPVATDLYVQGVGLGAQGGKVGDAVEEANRSTKGGYAEFVEKAKDKAKERYESMG